MTVFVITGSGGGIENIRDVRNRAPPGDILCAEAIMGGLWDSKGSRGPASVEGIIEGFFDDVDIDHSRII